jgi:hypothetical protein
MFGALLVEIDSEGRWFVRQVIGNKKGDLQDLDVVVSGGKVTTGNRVEAITWGDFHSAHLDPTVRSLGWAPGPAEARSWSMLDFLRPKEQHVHDLLDFYSRNHHDRKNPRKMFARWAEGKDKVADELAEAAKVLCEIERPWAKTVVVDSNHDRAMQRWLDEVDGREDPQNARFWFQANDAVYGAIEDGDDLHLLEWAMRRHGCPQGVRFLREDESHVICGDIECGIHGDRGASGTRGTIAGLAQIGDRLNGADKHQAAILWGSYWAGTSSKLKLGYTAGPLAWTHSHIVTYPNGKRTIVTMYGGKWRA